MRTEYKVLFAASLLANFGDNLIGPFYAVFVERIGGTILQIGYTAAVFSFASGLLVVAVGRVSDILRKETISVLGYGLYALGSLGYLVISRPWQLFALQIIFALGTACLMGPLSALFARYIESDRTGFQWGLQSGGDKVVVGLAVLMGTVVVCFCGFRPLFLLMFAIQVVALIVQARLCLPSKMPTVQPEAETAV